MSLPDLFAELLLFDDSPEMNAAVKSKSFYVIATPCMNDRYSIGVMEETLPLLFATEAAANDELAIDQREAEKEIKQGLRDSELDSVVLQATWDGHSEYMELHENGCCIHRERWRSLAGL